MISGLVNVARPDAPDSVDLLADTLNALVAGVAAGLVGDAVIVAPYATEALEAVAEGSGAAFAVYAVKAGIWRAAAASARGDWGLCLEAGDVMREGWIRTLDRFSATASADVALARLRRPHAGQSAYVASVIDRLVGASHARAGDLVRRDRLLAGPFRPRLKPQRLSAGLERL